ncbi:MAG: type II secretion system protein [Sulfuricurvum sp.]|uniref:type II secretion system protein n=1 Tax=Sulfuricurvum sp. TaxID=2025608 RepID=UPI00263221A2|nr:type II secretion system protein [Sulfuricurvum sp.]MDD2368802.1 type II secretion system protein [Sulfuricurvum sp.]MDD2950851.1 type II secretion system protein [Sulfuricurvum sp.]MDD5117537.1 type II secretion system protein [Sulfuricurvum sp.]
MKRSGFTMIELIFVIVILGILAAVALPKFIGVASQAQEGKLKAYVGTLNRTVAPALWSDAISNNLNGIIKNAAPIDYSKKLVDQIETPVGTGDAKADDLTVPDLTKCVVYKAPAANTGYKDAELAAWGIVSTGKIGTVQYDVMCMDGSMSSAPHFALKKTDGTSVTYPTK